MVRVRKEEMTEMEYHISYEIMRYEVRLTINGNDLGGNNYFFCEEEAVAFAREYVQEHPQWTATILRVERGVVTGSEPAC